MPTLALLLWLLLLSPLSATSHHCHSAPHADTSTMVHTQLFCLGWLTCKQSLAFHLWWGVCFLVLPWLTPITSLPLPGRLYQCTRFPLRWLFTQATSTVVLTCSWELQCSLGHLLSPLPPFRVPKYYSSASGSLGLLFSSASREMPSYHVSHLLLGGKGWAI